MFGRRLVDRINSLPEGDFERRQRAAERNLMHMGITFNVYGDDRGQEKILPFDLVPRLVTAEEWEWIVGVNVLGVAHGVIAFGPILAEAGEGHIVNTASEAGLVTNTVLGMYCATKHAVVGLSESLWRELHPMGVGVSCLCPNLVNTRIFQSERNRPYAAELTATQNAIMTPMREMISARGMAPSEAARHVADAIVEDRFWVFTHDITPAAAAVRFTDIEARRNPTDPYGGMEL